jgi:hypothetical protein
VSRGKSSSHFFALHGRAGASSALGHVASPGATGTRALSVFAEIVVDENRKEAALTRWRLPPYDGLALV